jgi:hypothetical protein
MKKIIFCFIIALGTVGAVNAQNQPSNARPVDTNKKMEDVVYLKNGAIIRGVIIEQVPDKTLEIKSNDNNYLIFNYSEIQKITKENVISDATDYKKKGFLDITELTYGFGINTINTYHGSVAISKQFPTIGIRSINGYQFNEHISCGFGVGFEAFLDGDNKGALIPLTLDFRYNFKKGKITPTVNLNGGYSVGVENSSGLAANPSVGMKMFLNKKMALLFNLGYKVQQQTVKQKDQWGGYVNRIVDYQFLSLSAGLSF